jgi:hypothetical protein
MSTPISTLPKTDSNEPELEVDEVLEDELEKPLTEVEASETDETGAAADEAESEATEETESAESSRGWGLVALILAALLVGSVAINLKQSRDVAALEEKSAEFEQALDAAVERIDVETSRADGAESALERVDSAVDLVNERVLGLQEALDGLREATVR